jgi:hypothetical protein
LLAKYLGKVKNDLRVRFLDWVTKRQCNATATAYSSSSSSSVSSSSGTNAGAATIIGDIANERSLEGIRGAVSEPACPVARVGQQQQQHDQDRDYGDEATLLLQEAWPSIIKARQCTDQQSHGLHKRGELGNADAGN